MLRKRKVIVRKRDGPPKKYGMIPPTLPQSDRVPSKSAALLSFYSGRVLRRDIPCGLLECTVCATLRQQITEMNKGCRITREKGEEYPDTNKELEPALEEPPSNQEQKGTNPEECASTTAYIAPPSLTTQRPILIPNADIVIALWEMISSPTLGGNVVLLNSVLDEVRVRARQIYHRIRTAAPVSVQGAQTQQHAWFYFPNEFHEECALSFELLCAQRENAIAGDTSLTSLSEAVNGLPSISERRVNEWLHTSAVDWYRAHMSRGRLQGTVISLATLENVEDYLHTLDEKIGVDFLERARLALQRTQEWKETASIGTRGGDAASVPWFEKALCSHNTYGHTDHVSSEEAKMAFERGELFQGTVRMSSSSPFYATISVRRGEDSHRILLKGTRGVNRCLDGDTVAVALWNQSSTDASESNIWKQNVEGVVRCIIESKRRVFCGSLDMEDPTLFIAADSRIPRIRLLGRSRNVTTMTQYRLRVAVDGWGIDSLYPHGHIEEVMGPIGDRDVEARVILTENNIPAYEFSEAVLDCLPKGDWVPDLTGRLDMRDYMVCSVDPEGCKDIDDALHCRLLPNGNFEVGVHIADVSTFVQEGTELDREAQLRCTSVYLVDRRIDMLPKILTEKLCSLVSNEDRYTFSALFEMDKDANLISETYTKGIIRSVAALSYRQAQDRIDDPADQSPLTESLRNLLALSTILRERRKKEGAVFLHSQQFKFKLNADHLSPHDMMTYESLPTNTMIEEWMLKANEAVARKVHSVFPKWTLLRRHLSPNPTSLDSINDALHSYNPHFCIRTQTSADLNHSLDEIIDNKDKNFNSLVRGMVTRCMQRAVYISSGDVAVGEYQHYGLALPIYTHFTSPIRRYADLVVHRQLAAAIGISSVSRYHTDREFMTCVARQMNLRHENAQKAGRDSQAFFMKLYISSLPTIVDATVQQEGERVVAVTSGYIIKIREDGNVIVSLPKFGLEGPLIVPSNFHEKKLLDVQSPNAPNSFALFTRVCVDIVVQGRTGVSQGQVQQDALFTRLQYRLSNQEKRITTKEQS